MRAPIFPGKPAAAAYRRFGGCSAWWHGETNGFLRKDVEPRSARSRRKILQESALRCPLTPDTAGNMVVGSIPVVRAKSTPRQFGGYQDSIFTNRMCCRIQRRHADVRFPHRQHTLWLDCNAMIICSSVEAGATKFDVEIRWRTVWRLPWRCILSPTECFRCHSVARPGDGNPGLVIAIPPVRYRPRAVLRKFWCLVLLVPGLPR